mgnify:FL=1
MSLPDQFDFRGGEGAGDMHLILSTATTWARRQGVEVDLYIHWAREEDWLFHPIDTETVRERYEVMLERMVGCELVTMEHVWGSDMCSYLDVLMDDDEARHTRDPHRYYLQTQVNGKERPEVGLLYPLCDYWMAEGEWKDSAHTNNKTIAYWDFEHNAGPVKDYKNMMDWGNIHSQIVDAYPDHEVVRLTYRDSFKKAYDTIQGCDFCVGYDGMWHMIARQFGKHFITFTDDILLATMVTYPNSASFDDGRQFFEHLYKMAEYDYRQTMMDYSSSAQKRRLDNCLNLDHRGYLWDIEEVTNKKRKARGI